MKQPTKIEAATALTFYLTFMVTWTYSFVGRPIVCDTGGTYSWPLPVAMFLILVIPALLGYLLGKAGRSRIDGNGTG